MTLSQLRTFVAVATTGSIRRAAEQLLVAQPSVSAAVATLQRELGVALLARDGRGIRVTRAGELFAGTARRALGLIDQAVGAARSVDAPGAGSVRITAVTTAAEHLLPAALAAFRRHHPGVDLTLTVGNRTRVWDSLAHHEADLGIGGRPPTSGSWQVLGLAPNRLVVVGPAGGGNDLVTRPWLLREAGSGTRNATDALLAELGLDPPTMVLGSNGAIERSVAAGLGVSLVSHNAVADAIARGTTVVLPCPGTPIERPWHLVAPANEPLTPTAALLVRSLVVSGAPFRLTPDGRRALRQ